MSKTWKCWRRCGGKRSNLKSWKIFCGSTSRVYAVYLEHTAERDFQKLPAEFLSRIIAHIKNLAENPRPPGCWQLTDSKKDWRIRVGDYRIIYEIDRKAKSVWVMRVRYRKELSR